VSPSPPGGRFAIVVSIYYETLAVRLLEGAQAELRDAGVEDIEVHTVPGAFELPMAARTLATSGRFAAVVCLGAVLRGETAHFDLVCAETARGIQDVQLRTGVPCSFGVLTCDTAEQALARSGGEKRHAGRQAASAALALARLTEPQVTHG
jgi:6,7-dimethyl-8-ribityllumazine synthase